MKKPEEIKKGLECCANSSFCDEECPYFEECNEGLESHATDALSYIQQLEAENHQLLTKAKQLEAQVPRWISVEERLPEGEDPVLILVKETEHYGLHKEKSKVYYCQYLAYWDDEEWYTTWCNGCRKITDTANEPNADDYEVTHWMPLPEAPKEDAK